MPTKGKQKAQRRKYMPCDCCKQSAGFRLSARVGGVTRHWFACDNQRHLDGTHRRLIAAVGERMVTGLHNPTGFAAESGRALGPEPASMGK